MSDVEHLEDITRLETEIERLRAALELEQANYKWLVGVMRNAIASEDWKEARRALEGMKPDQGIGALDAATEPEEK
jgi:hypothetical protein